MKKMITMFVLMIALLSFTNNDVNAVSQSSNYKYNSKWSFQYNSLTKKTSKNNTHYIYLSPSVFKYPNIKKYINNAIARVELVDNDKGSRAANFNVEYTSSPEKATIIINVDGSTVKTSGKNVILGKAVPCVAVASKLKCDDDGTLGYLSTKDKVDKYNLIIYKKSFDKVYKSNTHQMYYEYVILHELGHSFGMGHLYSENLKRICQIDKDSYLSIMCYQNYSAVKNYTFTKADRLRLVNIYGK